MRDAAFVDLFGRGDFFVDFKHARGKFGWPKVNVLTFCFTAVSHS